jgi:hypothetical protein
MTNGIGPDSFTNFTTGGACRDDRAPWQREPPRRPVGGIGPASLGVAVTLLLVALVVFGIAVLT